MEAGGSDLNDSKIEYERQQIAMALYDAKIKRNERISRRAVEENLI